MATNYPQNLDDFRNPQPNDPVSADHAQQHANANDAIEALEAKVGVDGSEDVNSIDYKLSDIQEGDKALPKTNPQVDGDISLTGNIKGEQGNRVLDLTDNENAVNRIEIENSVTGQSPKIEAVGTDTDIDVEITPKGNGKVKAGAVTLPNTGGNNGEVPVANGDGTWGYTTIISPDSPLLKASGYLLAQAQEVPDLTLRVSAGTFIYDHISYEFPQTTSPSFSVPSSNDRIDLIGLEISEGSVSISITEGEENVSPEPPATPINVVPLAYVYNRPGQTAILDGDDTVNGYIYRDIRPIILVEEKTTTGKFINQTMMDIELRPINENEIVYQAFLPTLKYFSSPLYSTRRDGGATTDFEYFWSTHMASDDPQVELYQLVNSTTFSAVGADEISASQYNGFLIPLSSTQALYISFTSDDTTATATRVILVTWTGSAFSYTTLISGAGSTQAVNFGITVKKTSNPNEWIIFSQSATSTYAPNSMAKLTYNPAGPSASFSEASTVPYPSGLGYMTGWSNSFAYLGNGYFVGRRNASGDSGTRNDWLIWKSDGTLVMNLTDNWDSVLASIGGKAGVNISELTLSVTDNSIHQYFEIRESSQSGYGSSVLFHFDTSTETFVFDKRLTFKDENSVTGINLCPIYMGGKDGYVYMFNDSSSTNPRTISRVLETDLEFYPGIEDISETNKLGYMASLTDTSTVSLVIQKSDGSEISLPSIGANNIISISANRIIANNFELELAQERVLLKNINTGYVFKLRQDGNLYLYPDNT